MKNRKRRSTSNAREFHKVRLEFEHPTAMAVAIAGTFNNWRGGANPLTAIGNGRWTIELELPAGRYEYRLVADGEWMLDPAATETVPNPFGGRNSVMCVPKVNGVERKRF